MTWTMTLAEIKAHGPCEDGWKMLRKFISRMREERMKREAA